MLVAECKPKQVRVFFALWPDEAVLKKLDCAGREAHERCGGRRMRCETLHLTLAFVGGIPAWRLRGLMLVAAAVRAPRFELVLDRLDYVDRKKIVWASASLLPEALRKLAAALNARLLADGFRIEERPFAAHVTLLRNAHRPEDGLPELAPISWPVGEFVLVESELIPERTNYRVIGCWAARAAAFPAAPLLASAASPSSPVRRR